MSSLMLMYMHTHVVPYHAFKTRMNPYRFGAIFMKTKHVCHALLIYIHKERKKQRNKERITPAALQRIPPLHWLSRHLPAPAATCVHMLSSPYVYVYINVIASTQSTAECFRFTSCFWL